MRSLRALRLATNRVSGWDASEETIRTEARLAIKLTREGETLGVEGIWRALEAMFL